MQTPSATTTISITAHPWRVWMVLLCLSLSGVSHAAEPIRMQSAKADAQPKFVLSAWQLKDRLAWLRDIAVKGLSPKNVFSLGTATTAGDAMAFQLTADHELFKPMGEEARRIMVKQLLEQESGLQVRDNLRLQWDVTQFRTVDDQQDLDIKLGIHFGFH